MRGGGAHRYWSFEQIAQYGKYRLRHVFCTSETAVRNTDSKVS